MNNALNRYLVIDIGTGNVRVALTRSDGEVLGVERGDVRYFKDEQYPEAIYFDPHQLWEQIMNLTKDLLNEGSKKNIVAVTVSSQREGIVLLDKSGSSLVGLPNHDHRGRQWEIQVQDKDLIYSKCGRYPSSLFSALKLVGMREKRPEIFERLHSFLSISDWAQYMLCGVQGYEHSQASETLLYDVEKESWSHKLCGTFNLDPSILPPLHNSGDILGPLLSHIREELGLSEGVQVIVGGSDTQLAIKSTSPSLEDIVIVAGTTTPIVKLTSDYLTDPQQKTWTNRHIEKNQFVLETNAGVTGLNYQRLKEIFYPKEDYDIIEQELEKNEAVFCTASLGSLIADEDVPLTRGGFIFDTPIAHNLSRADFVQASFWDMACCIKENYEYLHQVSPHGQEYVWGCGGGFQSKTLAQLLADLLGKKIRVRNGFEHASIIGGLLVCNQALEISSDAIKPSTTEIMPRKGIESQEKQEAWKRIRNQIKNTFTSSE